MIRGYFDENGAPHVDCLVDTLARSVVGKVSFAVSTGSMITRIHPEDAKRLGIGYDTLYGSTEMHTDHYGSAFTRVYQVCLDFDDDGQRASRYTNIRVVEFAPDGFPSILGWDVIRTMGQMVCNFPEKMLSFTP